ncbi:MAG: HupE/UreJ family protein [Vicinamibacterales bacterium]|nr:HupE/UreJ family protein [Vicinamibacterales bacterium]
MNLTQRSAFRLLGAALLFLSIQTAVRAHDIPDEIVIQAYLRPEQTQLKVLLRIPLLALGESSLPKDGTGYLALSYIDPALREAANQISNGIVLVENGERLMQYEMASGRISLPSDKSFDTFDGAIARTRGAKIPDNTQVYYNQGFLDLELNYPIRSRDADFGMQVLFGRGLANRTATYINFIRPSGDVRAFRLHDDASMVHLDPRFMQAAWGFLSAGFYRFLDGLDHLVFVFVLALPYRRVRDLVKPLAAFAAAHSITLTAAALGLEPSGPWFPPLVGTLMAFSILYVAVENAIGANLKTRWIVALVFGLVHGFGFALAFGDLLQFAGGHKLAALVSFNIGLELGQIIILLIAVPALTLLFTQVFPERAGSIVLSAIVAHSAWHWMMDRLAVLRTTDWPVMDAPTALILVRWLLALTVVAGAVWFVSGLLRRKPTEPEMPEPSIVDRR